MLRLWIYKPLCREYDHIQVDLARIISKRKLGENGTFNVN